MLLCFNLVTTAFAAFKMARRAEKIPQKSGEVFSHVTHDKMTFSKVISSDWQPYLFSGNINRCLNETDTSLCLT